MFKNHLKIAIRNLLKHKTFSLINITGLAVGLTCCLLISLFIKDELSYDRYLEKADRIFKVVTHSRSPERESQYALTPAPLAEALVRDFPEVETTTRLFTLFGDAVVMSGEKRFNERRIFFGDSTFFDVFSIPLVAGHPKTALAKPASLVITETMAQKYFGSEDPLGKTMRINDDDFQITGVMRDVPANSHFHCDFLISLASAEMSRNPSFISNINFHTYLVLRDGTSPHGLESKFPVAIKRYASEQIAARFGQTFEQRLAAGNETRWSLLPLTDTHLHSQRDYEIEPNGSIVTVYLFSAIAVIVLLIACINFMNLATTRSASRAREIGVRKVVGSNRLQLLRQFLAESILLSFLALLLALVLVKVLLPGFNALADKQMDIDFLAGWKPIAALLGITLAVGILAGSYPAFLLSSLRPAFVLKTTVPAGGSASWVRRGLVVFQFAISVGLIAGTLIVHNQLRYVLNRQLGFDKEQVLVVNRAQALGEQREAFRQRLLQNPDIVSAATSATLPGKMFGRSTYRGLEAPSEESHGMHQIYVDEDFMATLGIDLVVGRNFSRDFATDSSAVLLNETAAQKFGWADPIGRQLIRPGNAEWLGTIIGVVKDFHFESLHKPIQPLVIRHEPFFQYFSVRVRPEKVASAVEFVGSVWQEFAPQQPFEYSFLDTDLDRLYRAEQRTGQIFGIFAALAIFVACLGQFGLTAYTIERRTKEIGIRKVLGASVAGISALLSKEFVKLILVAIVIASPVAYYAMTRWLQHFAYRVEIDLWVFALAGGLALIIALLTVSAQAIKAALANPVESLKYE